MAEVGKRKGEEAAAPLPLFHRPLFLLVLSGLGWSMKKMGKAHTIVG